MTYVFGSDIDINNNRIRNLPIPIDSQEAVSKSYSDITLGALSCAYGIGSHAEGTGTIATGNYSHSEGCHTVASGNYSHAEGISTVTIGIGSHAEGYYTIASGGHGSHSAGIESYARVASQHSESAGKNTNIGDAQHSRYFLAGITTSTASTGLVMASGLGATLAMTGIPLQPKSVLSFHIIVSAYATGLNGGGSGGGWTIEGAVIRTGTVPTAGSTTLLGTPRWAAYTSTNMPTSFGAGIAVDSPNSLLKVMVTGLSSPVNWQATVLASEVSIIP